MEERTNPWEERNAPWEECCEHEGDAGHCMGVALGDDGKCLAHTSPDWRDQALASLQAGADLSFTRGVPLTDQLLAEILRWAPRTTHGRPLLRNADFDSATFSGDADFMGATFEGDARFWRATFGGEALFLGATFNGDANFIGITLAGSADFSRVTFRGDASFGFYGTTRIDDGVTIFTGEVTFSGFADFSQVVFGRNAIFYGAAFRGDASFTGGTTFSGIAAFNDVVFERNAGFWGATFGGDARFPKVNFSQGASFRGAIFSGVADFGGVTFGSDANFSGVTFGFEKAGKFGPVVASGTFFLDEVVFPAPIDIEASARALSCRRSKFSDWANLRIRWADVNLEDAHFASACLVERAPFQFEALDESQIVDERDPAGQPRVVSVRRVNAANLVLANVDLHPCRFAGAYKLDALRIASGRQFAKRPQGWKMQLAWPPLWKWTVRRAVAEEHEWRYRHERGIRRRGWYHEACQPPPPENVVPASAAEIQAIYRDLRKGREDSKDEPGAADFYYGEMEMRRAATPRSFEKLLLFLYWLVSGYGLRGSRALISLGVTVMTFAFLLYIWGFSSPQPFVRALLFSAESTTSLLRAPEQALTTWGEMFQMIIRLLGPLFFGLTLLSLRGRVKR